MRRNRKNNLVLVFVALLLILGIGYALLSTTLSINGATNVSSASWNIYWDNIVLGSNNVTDITTPATISTGKTEVSFNVNFKEPGDTYEFTVDAVNDGSIDGMVNVVTNGVYAANGTTPKTLPAYLEYTVTYSDGVAIEQNQLLKSGERETYKVRVHYKEDITASQLPSTADNYVFKFEVTYVQADENAIAKPQPYVYTVNKYNLITTEPKYNAVWLNQTFPASITQYQTASEALSAIAAGSGKDLPFYLKHKVENGIVTESYVEFVVTSEMAEANTGMVAGTYTLRGGINESSLTDKPIYIQNAKTIYDAFGTKCSTNPYTTTITSSDFYCTVSGLGAYAYADGRVYAYNYGGSSWYVYSSGISYFNW